MTSQNSATATSRVAPLPSGTALAALGVLAFSFTFPATVAALDGFGPWTATGVRGTLAAVIAGSALVAARAPLPVRGDWPALIVVALGCVLGFPLLTTLALQTSSTAHSAVVIGALPMATAAISALRTGRHPSPAFWIAAGVGAAAVLGFTLAQSHGRLGVADLYLVAALLVCAAGYAEGGRLAAHLPGWRVIAWAIVLAAPVSLAVTAWALPREALTLTPTALAGMAWLGAVSQFGGFVVWYRGMGIIGVTRASQLQLVQPLLTLVWAVLLLGEQLPASVPLTAAVVLGCIVATQRAQVG